MGGILATAAPYLAYLYAQRAFGREASLANLSPRRLLACVVLYAVANPVLHHIWFAIYGPADGLWRGLAAMIAGDLLGSLIVIYTGKMLLALIPAKSATNSGDGVSQPGKRSGD